jgi:hypothetical protein
MHPLTKGRHNTGETVTVRPVHIRHCSSHNYIDRKLNNCSIYSEQFFLTQFTVAHLVLELPVVMYTCLTFVTVQSSVNADDKFGLTEQTARNFAIHE